MERTKTNYEGRVIQIIDYKPNKRYKGITFSNVTPLSIHTIIKAPAGFTNNKKGVWIEGGNDDPIKILTENYIFYELKRTKYGKH